MKMWKLLPLFVLLVVLVGCRQPAATTDESQLQVDLRVDPEAPIVGDAMLIVTVQDADGQPINAATVTARGDINHAGMVPVIETAEQAAEGEYRIPFAWTMAGDWVVEITVELESGVVATETYDLEVGN